jgi:hypothetical protein
VGQAAESGQQGHLKAAADRFKLLTLYQSTPTTVVSRQVRLK